MTKQLTDEELLQEIQRRMQHQQQNAAEIETLQAELRQLNLKLEESELLKSHFISNVANEIINPFSSIIGLSKAILSVDKENWKKVISMVALIHSEAFNLDFQLRNIFMAAKIEAGEGSPEFFNVDLKNIINSVIESFKIELKRKKLTVVFNHEGKPEELVFKTDPEKMKLVISNLLSNAIKYSFEEGNIEIGLKHENQTMTIDVTDHGIGLSADSKRSIFDRFNRITHNLSINSNVRGHGLGLSVSKAIVDLLNGDIQIESVIGKGARFTLTFPEIDTPVSGFSSEANEIFFTDDDEDTEIF